MGKFRKYSKTAARNKIPYKTFVDIIRMLIEQEELLSAIEIDFNRELTSEEASTLIVFLQTYVEIAPSVESLRNLWKNYIVKNKPILVTNALNIHEIVAAAFIAKFDEGTVDNDNGEGKPKKEYWLRCLELLSIHNQNHAKEKLNKIHESVNEIKVPVLDRTNFNELVRIADSNLVVIKSILMTWGLEQELQNERMTSLYVPYAWSDKILLDMAADELDFAIYNDSKIDEFLERHTSCSFTKVSEFGFSMGGKNFYILGSKDVSLSKNKKDIISSLKGTTFAVPMNSDIHKNVIDVLGGDVEKLYKSDIRFIDYKTFSGLDVLNISSNIFLSSGQNIRLQAKYRDSHKEVMNFDHSDEKEKLIKKSKNSLIINNRIVEKIGRDKTYQIVSKIKDNFRKAWNNEFTFQYLLEQLYTQLKEEWSSKEEAYFVIRSILYESYRIGEPIFKR